MPQFNYNHPVLFLGQVASGDPMSISSYVNELFAQETRVAVGAAPGAGDYTLQIEGPEGTFSFSHTSPGGETQAQIVAALLAALQADPDLANIVAGTDASPNLDLAFIHEGIEYTVTATSNPGGALTITETQASGGTAIGLGLGVVPGSAEDLVIPPTGASTDADLLGITCKASIDIQVNDGLAASTSEFAPSSTVSVLEAGEVVVNVEDAVAFNGAVFMRTANATAAAPLGGFRSDADGGDAIAITGAKFRSSTTGSGLAIVKLNRPT